MTWSATNFHAEDDHDPRFRIDGRLTDGVLTFVVVAVRGRLRGQYSGRDFFDQMMAHFGDRVEVIAATWLDHDPAMMTNLDIFNAELRSGATMEEAAFVTKTGRWALDYGFTQIVEMDLTPDTSPFTQVLVEFVKPLSGKVLGDEP